MVPPLRVWLVVVTTTAACGDNIEVPPDGQASGLVALGLSFAGGRLSNPFVPEFFPGVSDYSVEVGFWLQDVQVTATAANDAAVVTINGVQTPSGQPSSSVALDAGTTTITILVSSDVGPPKTYSLDVIRAAFARQEAYVKAGYTAADDLFGEGIAIEGDTLAIAARLDDHVVPESGAVYTFRRAEDTWVQEAFLKASNPGFADHFGGLDSRGLALWGDTLAVAAPEEDGSEPEFGLANQTDSGAVYVFRRDDGTWYQEAYLKKPDPQFGERFGTSVALWGDTLVVGARDVGLVYVFTRVNGTWSLLQVLEASNGPGDWFGWDVAMWEDTIVVSAPGESSASAGVDGNQDDNSLSGSGATYVFESSSAGWTQTAYIKASNPGQDDYFGTSISLSADTLVVGASLEDSMSTGINGDQEAGVSNVDTGAVYVFVRQGTSWTQEAYVKASDVDAADSFGRSVGVWGNTLVAGALGEDSPSTGLDGSQSDAIAGYDSGSAYVFTRRGTEWTQKSYVKASTNGISDWFGFRVAVWGDTVLVGTMNEDSTATGIDGDQTDDSAPQSGAAFVFR